MKNKKFFLFLLGAVAFMGLLFYLQLKKAENISIVPEEKPLVEDELVYIPVTSTDPIVGNPGAPMTIVEFSNFGCAQCVETHATLSRFTREHPQQVRLIWKDAANTGLFSDNYELAHRSAYCAGKQGKFWQFAETVMQNKRNVRENELQKIASELALNLSEWWLCANSDEAGRQWTESLENAKTLNVKTLPAIFINNKRVNILEGVDLTEMLKMMTKKVAE